MNFPSQIFFNDINHGYRAAILKKNYLWLLPFYMVVATYFYYEKVHRTMQLQLYQTSLLDNSLIDSLVLQVAGVTGKASNPPPPPPKMIEKNFALFGRKNVLCRVHFNLV